MSKSYKEILNDITTFIFDIDGVLTDGSVHVTDTGEMLRIMNIRDGFALKAAIENEYKVCIISGGTNEGVRDRLKALGIFDIYLGAHHKLAPYQELLDNYDLSPDEILYMGDDVPDIPVMEQVALGVCPNDAVIDVKNMADYVSHKKGGEGCVRDIIEQTLRVQGKWITTLGAKND